MRSSTVGCVETSFASVLFEPPKMQSALTFSSRRSSWERSLPC